jgi:hypothetical protein
MKKINFLIHVLGILISISMNLTAQNYMRVVDPKTTWRNGTPSITQATISIRPRGLYVEYGVYLTYSAQQTLYNLATDTLEIQHYFQLPQGAAFNDSWLWVDNFIMKALLWDRVSATSLYEGIVKRRQDPSILYKNGTTNYEYRIFPLVGNQTRRVKLNFYMPAKWSPSQLTSAIPLSILTTSSRIPTVDLIVYESNNWANPTVDMAPNLTWTTITDSTFGTSKRATLTGLNSASVANISYKSMENNPYFFSNAPIAGTDEGYYQLAFSPKAIINDTTSVPKKILFLIDYDASKTILSAQQIQQMMKKNIRENLNPRDSFNIFYNRLTTQKVYSNWVVADSANIERAFATISSPSVGMNNTSILSSMIPEGYDFVKTRRGGEVLIASSNGAFASLVGVQNFYADLERQFSPLPITHVFDFSSKSLTQYLWAQNRSYYGNELLYNVLTSNTRGNFVNVASYYPTVAELEKGATDIFQQLIPSSPIDVTVKPTVGLTYERFNLAETGSQTFMQVGKYKGTLPLNIDVTTINALNQIVTGRLVVQANPIAVSDSSNKQLFGAAKIRSMETTVPMNNSLINRIIQESKTYRILSNYTAFIALEPSLQKPCDSCRDETGGIKVLGIKEVKNDSVKITVFPNPFKESVTISIEKPAASKMSNTLITNLLGQTVKVFTESELKENSGKVVLNWQDTAISAGTYLFSTTIGNKRYVQKLVKIRE